MLSGIKHWLSDHGTGAETGGIAGFAVSMSSNYELIVPPSPAAYSYIFTELGGGWGHALTVVGYNDSIFFDFNNDGQITTTIDINGDSIVDIRDREMVLIGLAEMEADIFTSPIKY